MTFLLGRFDHIAGLVEARHTACRAMAKAIAAVQALAMCLAPVMHQRLFCGSQHQIVSYDNEFTVKWRRGFDWKQRP